MDKSTLLTGVNEVIELVPDALLDQLSNETGVDYSVQKLQGKVIFKLFLYAILSQRKISLRILAAIFASEKFNSLFAIKSRTIKHSALGMRLQNIDYKYFQRIFEHLIASPKLTSVFFSDKKVLVRKIDSTVVTISSKLLKFGMENSHGSRKFIKYSLELAEGLPINILLFKEQSFISEDKALPEVINIKPNDNRVNIAIFDRGVQKKKTFTDLVDRGIYFVTRTKHKFKVIEDRSLIQTETDTLVLLSDQVVQFSKVKTGDRRVTLAQKFRLIIGKNKKTGEYIRFLTNVDFLSATEVTDLYKSRWEIETFFKFIKQELNFSHLLSRTENGILSVMYLTMITAILLTIYKKMNKLVGWAVVKIRFLDELETEMMKLWYAEIHPIFSTSTSSSLNSS